jgi:RecA/RadA recombinase
VIIENVNPDIERRETGLFSLDRALGGGLPLRSFLEISGWEGSGKSTLAYYLLGVAGWNGAIGIHDNEGFDPSYAGRAAAQSDWYGTLKIVPVANKKGEPMSEEESLDALADYLYDDNVTGILLDSIGGLSPVGEEEGSTADANMGKRAQITGRFLRRCVHRLRGTVRPKVLIATNHIHQNIGGQGTSTSGGKAVHYLAATRIRLNADKDEGWWLVHGKITKRRYHGTNPIESFQFVLVPGEGVHPGLTAVQDCITFGLAEFDRVVKLDGNSYGYWKNIVEERNSLDFAPFHTALKDAYNEVLTLDKIA